MERANLDYKQKLKENISILIENEKLNEAKELLELFEQVEHNDIEIYSMKGVIAMMEGDLGEAERVLKDGFSLDKTHFDINYNLGYFYQLKEEKESAIKYYNKALENSENELEANDVATILKTLGVEVGAETVLEKDPKSSDVSQVEDNIMIINTDDMEAPSIGNDLYSSRKNVYDNLLSEDAKTATIVIPGYNRIEKTKYCVECVLNYTKDIDYELILLDNGSSDGTFEYFKSVEYKDKRIIHVTKNVGGGFPFSKSEISQFKSKYLVLVSNDVYVTPNWLSNLIKCMESSNKIGWVMPMSSNISNLQDPGLVFNSLDEMQQKAELFNKSDPLKWERRLRLVNVIAIYKKETFDMVGIFDAGFFHDFGEDDYSIRLRRMGYDLILCGDTFVHHDHDFKNYEDKDPEMYIQSLNMGRKNFKEKYYGLDAWDDINNFERNLISLLPKIEKSNKINQILGIDIRCGTPILEVENYLLKNNLKKNISSAFTTQAKYYLDLKTVCKGNVYCDRIEYLHEYLIQDSYDYIIMGESINEYMQPLRILDTVILSAKKGGKILLKLSNINDVNKFLEILGSKPLKNNSIYTSMTLEKLIEYLETKNVKDIKITAETYNTDEKTITSFKEAIKATHLTTSSDRVLQTILTKQYLLCMTKH